MPGVVPAFEGGVVPLPPPPQPIAAIETKKTSRPSIDNQLRLRAGMPKKNTIARTAPPADGQKSFIGLLRAVVAAVVPIVSTSVCAVVPLIVTDAEAKLHVAGSVAALVVMVQVMATAPVNPPVGVTVIVEVLPLVAPGLTVMLPLFVSVKLGAAVTVAVTVVVCVIVP